MTTVAPNGWYLSNAYNLPAGYLSANDASLDQTVEDIIKEVRLASGALKRYKQAQMMHWTFNYKYLWNLSTRVADGGLGRDALYALRVADQEMTLGVPAGAAGQPISVAGFVNYTVRFAANRWQERIVHRNNDSVAWALTFELVQTQ